MQCPYCLMEIKEIESCPKCGWGLVYLPKEGPHGTWECKYCSTPELTIGHRRTPAGLQKVEDLTGRYSPKKP